MSIMSAVIEEIETGCKPSFKTVVQPGKSDAQIIQTDCVAVRPVLEAGICRYLLGTLQSDSWRNAICEISDDSSSTCDWELKPAHLNDYSTLCRVCYQRARFRRTEPGQTPATAREPFCIISSAPRAAG